MKKLVFPVFLLILAFASCELNKEELPQADGRECPCGNVGN
jgi:hypothetical protein